MRRFATWTTGHRKTVIFSWILALIVIGGIAGIVGSDFSEEFKLPTSDSTEAYELLEDNFPQQSGGTATIVFKADEGVESPAVKQKMEGVFKEVERRAARHRSRQPLRRAAAPAAISKDGKIAYATIQYDVQGNEARQSQHRNRSSRPRRAPTAEASKSQLGGQPIEEAEEESGDSSFGIGLLAAIVILLLAFGSVVAMGLPIITALFALGVGLSLVTLGTHVFDTAELRAGPGGDDRARGRDRLRALHPHPLPQQPRRRAASRARRRSTRVDTAGRAVLFAGTTVIIALMGMFLLNITFLYGVAVAAALSVLLHDDRGADPAAGAARPGSGTGSTNGRSRASRGGQNTMREDTKWYAWSRWIQKRPWPAAILSGALLLLLCIPALSLRLGVNDAGTNPTGDDHARSLRPARRRLRPRLQRAVRRWSRKLPQKGAGRRDRKALLDAQKTKKASPRSPRSPSTRRRPSASARSTRRPRRRAPTRPRCSITSATT